MTRTHTLATLALVSLVTFAPVAGCAVATDDRARDDDDAPGGLRFTSPDDELSSSSDLTLSPGKSEPVCAAEVHEPELPPLDLLVLVDRSGSMGEQAGSTTRWLAVKDAVLSFAQSPDSSGIGMGVQFFPLTPPPIECDLELKQFCPMGMYCSANGYCISGADPTCKAEYDQLDVPVGALPGNAAKILDAFNAEGPSGSTPTVPALHGISKAARAAAESDPSRVIAVVLATDGIPSSCGSTVQGTADVAAATLAATPSVPTFVIGIGPGLDALNAIAAAGGTGSAFHLAGANVKEEFAAAMQKIRDVGICEYQIPLPQSGTADLEKVNVQITPPGGAATVVPMVGDASACNGAQGWHYNDPAAPTRIVLCPESCEVLKDGGAKLDILVGCKTILPK